MKKILPIILLSTLGYSITASSNELFRNNEISEPQGEHQLIDIDENDSFYLEPKEIRKGKVDPNGFAQQNTKNIPSQYEEFDYIGSLENEIDRLKDLPDDESFNEKGKALPILKLGSKGDNVKILSEGLVYNGFLQPEEITDVYDENMVKAVKEAQGYYGIATDGIAGKDVYRHIFINKEERINELTSWVNEVNNMVDIGRSEGKPFIVIVNVPSYTLHVIETNNKMEILESKIIVGKPSSKTPIYRANISGLKYYPTWNPPMSVVKKNVLPNMSLSSTMKVVNSRGQAVPISQVSRNDILTGKYSVQQTPGTHNSLGILKFETDSSDSIYLHDTNNRALFNKKDRALSLGCVRVQRWTQLSALIANADENYIFENINKKKTRIERTDKIPLFYTYSLIDSVDGKVGFYKDIYGRTNK